MTEEDQVAYWAKRIIGGVLALLLIAIPGGMWGCPKYHVWQQGLSGEAELNKAMANRKITIQEAEAKMEAAVMLAKAEIERARGVAEANKIIGQSLHDNADYLKYLWIQELSTTNNHVIYVPTEANLPILEAGRGVERFPSAPVATPAEK